MKLSASAKTAHGAVRIWTRAPPNPGPATCAAERLISSFEFPSMICARSTSDGRYDWYATSKKTWNTPTRNPTTKSWPSERTSATYAAGIVSRSNARPKSPMMRIGRRGSRSTHTPAGSVKMMKGRNSTVPRTATSKALASSTRIATSGSAS